MLTGLSKLGNDRVEFEQGGKDLVFISLIVEVAVAIRIIVFEFTDIAGIEIVLVDETLDTNFKLVSGKFVN